MKYYIIPTGEIAMEVEAEDKYSAMDEFALKVDFDLNAYFKAVTEDEYKELKEEIKWKHRKECQVDFYADELLDNFEDVAEEDVQKVAENAYYIYCHVGKYPYADVETEYDALERAVEEYNDGKEDEED